MCVTHTPLLHVYIKTGTYKEWIKIEKTQVYIARGKPIEGKTKERKGRAKVVVGDERHHRNILPYSKKKCNLSTFLIEIKV